jgi:di/tricarboxylate transporter
MQIALVLGLLVVAIALFATEKLSVDAVTLMLVIVLTLTGILTIEEAFSGFSSDFVVILASVFIISGALQETGILDSLGAQLARVKTRSSNFLLVVIMAFSGAVSAFMNNTTVTALFLGPLTSLCNRLGISPSKMLMPLAFASILGGTCTVIGTSTNVAVSGYIAKAGMQPVGLFELLPIGALLFGIGILYMATIGKWMLPNHKVTALTDQYAVRDYLTEIKVLDNSPLVGQFVFESDLSKMNFTILRVIRNKQNIMPRSTTLIEAGDVMLVKGKIDELVRVKETEGIDIKGDLLAEDLQNEDIKLAEIIITPRSSLVNCTLKQSHFLQKYGLKVLAIHRHRGYVREKIGDISLLMGDVLLVQGPAEKLEGAQATNDFAILGQFTQVLYKKRRGFITIGVFLLAILTNLFFPKQMPLSICFLAAAMVVVVVNKMTAERAYHLVDWRLLILIGGMSAFGIAMEKTGASAFVANSIVNLLEPLGVMAILAGFVLLTVLLTQPMSNAAAALVVLPVALKVAQQLDVNPRTFAIAVMLAASVSLITPFEPSCILVYGPGKYRFKDFLQTGSLLTLVMMAVIVFMVPVIWKL